MPMTTCAVQRDRELLGFGLQFASLRQRTHCAGIREGCWDLVIPARASVASLLISSIATAIVASTAAAAALLLVTAATSTVRLVSTVAAAAYITWIHSENANLRKWE